MRPLYTYKPIVNFKRMDEKLEGKVKYQILQKCPLKKMRESFADVVKHCVIIV